MLKWNGLLVSYNVFQVKNSKAMNMMLALMQWVMYDAYANALLADIGISTHQSAALTFLADTPAIFCRLLFLQNKSNFLCFVEPVPI